MNTIIIDYRTTQQEFFSLSKICSNIIMTKKYPILYSAIDGHPDIQVFSPFASKAIIHKEAHLHFIKSLTSSGIDVTLTNSSLGSKYPENVLLNAVLLKDYFIAALKFTDKSIIPFIDDKICINVKQGYTKCSTAVISNKALITSDKSIIKALEPYDIDVLEIPPGNIELPGLDYGFIGGTCGLLSEGELAFFGSLKKYRYGNEILKFLIKHDVKPIYLSDSHLIDRGSIIRV
ncbi:DUF6873 family GME fold protein [Oceanirhabdus sp. W0125-5]|uniref:DUF6873 family GME fold protein n=1 Tax=Oceanirhabdus sp. W0125-5 TaxID=2999116 RepID=UPI0022F31870|nr:hypothetical protein [Oceanirhabdus sp. W0125-5]WBW99402.1 hypothetical protein OW730_11850 [Oceanirhabdus sp. W0125-5]